ncbi:MAG: 50S ribosome-binding GTPase [Neomegalonema sp.]|nr:50S ribosome-binding GTPase [Neomegalonema sp.]
MVATDTGPRVRDAAEGAELARRLIAECKATRSEELDLGGLQLEELPAELLELTWLKRLWLGADKFSRETAVLIGRKRRNALQALPRAFGDALAQLELLDLGRNQIGDAGAAHLAGLKALTRLDLRDNGIGDDGAAHLAGLAALTSLDLSHNGIGADGATHLAGLKALTSLDLSFNEIGDEGAAHLAGLKALTSLDLRGIRRRGGNWISAAGAAHLAGLTALTSLDLSGNRIGADGAAHLAGLKALTRLSLRGNKIGAEGAAHLAGLTALTSLDLGGNRRLGGNEVGAEGARAILDAWGSRENAASAQHLDLTYNGDTDALLPQEILQTKRPAEILAAWKSRQLAEQSKEGVKPFNEAKLLIVGEEAVGKTSLLRYLSQAKPRIEGHAKTKGVDLVRWRLERQEAHKKWTLNAWDFAGQDTTFGTHQFFLTHRSIYLLVLTDRTENRRSYDEDLEKWLNTIRNRGGDSPVIVVINQSDEEKAKRVAAKTGKWGVTLDEEELREKVPNIVKILRTSCDANAYAARTISDLEDAIVDVLENAPQLDSIREPVPREWLRTKDRVIAEASDRKILPLSRYKEICQEPFREGVEPDALKGPAIEDPNLQRALLSMLSNLGVIVAYGLDEDASPTREKTLLDPNWLTDAFYSVLDSALIRDQHGEFSRSDLPLLLDEQAYPPKDHHFIVEMMMDGGIELAIPCGDRDADRYLMPQALDDKQPPIGSHIFDGEGVTRFRYRYRFLPPSFMPKFIVRTAARSYDPPHRWLTGVWLRINDCPVQVIESRVNNAPQIDISVAGPSENHWDTLRATREFMDQLHHDNPGAEPEPLVPLPDQPNLHVEVARLEKAAQHPKRGLDYALDVVGAERDYTVRELLEAGCYNRSEAKRPDESEPAEPQVDGNPSGRPAADGRKGVGWAAHWRVLSACALGVVFGLVFWLRNPLAIENQFDLGILSVLGGLAVALLMGFILMIVNFLFNPAFFYKRFILWLLPTVLASSWMLKAVAPALKRYFEDVPVLKDIDFGNIISDEHVYVVAGLIAFAIVADVVLQLFKKEK